MFYPTEPLGNCGKLSPLKFWHMRKRSDLSRSGAHTNRSIAVGGLSLCTGSHPLPSPLQEGATLSCWLGHLREVLQWQGLRAPQCLGGQFGSIV